MKTEKWYAKTTAGTISYPVGDPDFMSMLFEQNLVWQGKACKRPHEITKVEVIMRDDTGWSYSVVFDSRQREDRS